MTTIVSYQKHIDALITRTLRLPVDANNHHVGTELATLADGLTYVCLPDGAILPADQASEIAASIVNPVTLSADHVATIKGVSPHVRLINQRVTDAIAERYTQGDEIKLLRTAPSTEFNTYNAYVEDCRAWGRAEKAKIGL